MIDLNAVSFPPFTQKLDKLYPERAPHILKWVDPIIASGPMDLILVGAGNMVLNNWCIETPGALQMFLKYVSRILTQPVQ